MVKGLIRQRDEIDEIQCDFTSGRGTKYAFFNVCHLQKNHMTAYKPLYMTSIDLEEAFNQVPRDVI